MTSRRAVLRGLLAGALALQPLLASAAGRWRIVGVTYRGRTEVEDGFEAYLAARGIDADITWLDLARDRSRLPQIIAEIRRIRPDLIYTWGTTVSLGVLGAHDEVDPAEHVTDIPAVFTMVSAPVGAGLVPAFSSSGRLITGVTHMASLEAQLSAMRAYRPFDRLGVLYTASEKNSRLVIEALRRRAASDGFSLDAQPFPLDAAGRADGSGARAMLGRLKEAGADWLYLPPDSYLTTLARDLMPEAARIGLPSFAATEALVRAGALAGVVSRYHAVGQFTAYKAEQILVAGRRPAELPVETLSRFSLQINMPVARELALAPPLGMFDYAELLEPASQGAT